MGFARSAVIIASQSLNLGDIVERQQGGFLHETGLACFRC